MASAPITHVVLDMGNVLLRWAPRQFARRFTECEADALAVADSIFDSHEWSLVDAGAITEAAMLRVAEGRLEPRLHPALERTFAVYHALQEPIWATNRLARALAAAGAHLHILSNVGQRFLLLGPRIPIFGLTEGNVISSFEHVMKPDPAIYELFLGRFGLAAAECVFVDDMARNLVGAKAVGMATHHFTGDAGALRDALAEAGVPGAEDYRPGPDDELPYTVPDEVRARIPEVLGQLVAEGGRSLPNDPRPGPGRERLWPQIYAEGGSGTSA